MGQRVIGIDLGSYSVKVAELDAGFRSAQLRRIITGPVPYGPEPVLERSLEALAALNWQAAPTDVVSVAFPGDRGLLRMLDIPFADPRKIAAVVGSEVADSIPWEIDDVVYGYLALDGIAGKVLTATVRSEEIESLLVRLAGMNVDPRSVAFAPLAYAELISKVAPEEAVLVADLGHTTTNICYLVNGEVTLARTVSRGGHHITDALRRQLQLTYQEAETLKEERAILVPDPASFGPGDAQRVAVLVGQAFAPLARELRVTRGLAVSRTGREPDRVLLCGGTSRLQGIGQYLAAELNAPVVPLRYGDDPDFATAALTVEGEAMGALSIGVGLDLNRRKRIELRQGAFAYKTDRSFLSQKVWHIVAAVLTVLLFATGNAIVTLYALRSEERALKQQLKVAARAVLGESVSNPIAVSTQVRQGCRKKSFSIPQKTAFDILDLVSRKVPGKDKLKLDVLKLDISAGKTVMKATADTRSAVSDIVKALEGDQCISKVTTGKISDVSEGKKQFTLTMSTSCF